VRKRKACIRCGGEKGAGRGVKLCDACQIPDEERREIARQRSEDWYAENRARALERDRRKRMEDPVFAARKDARARQWVIANPEAAARIRHRNLLAYRARKAGAFVEAVEPLVVLERADGVCGICGGDVDPLKYEIDHIVPLSRGGEHSYRNVQPAHPRCNRTKGARVPEEVFA
jgi:5-methylcytosine-specific restriction endonuclease McrA